MANSLRLGMYPYTYARVSAMKGKLLQKDDYQRLMKMGVHEIVRFIQETEYRKEIDELAATHSGLQLIDIALHKNLARALIKIKRIAQGNLQIIFSVYLRRQDIRNIKTILRGKFTKADPTYVESLMLPVGDLKLGFLNKLIQKESIEDVMRELRFLDQKKVQQALKQFKETNNLFALENVLDQHYYQEMIEFTQQMPEQGTLFRSYLGLEIDILNIKTLLRLKREETPVQEIEPYLLHPGNKLKKEHLQKLLKITNMEDLLHRIGRYGFGKIIKETEEDYKAKKSLIGIEVALNRQLLQQITLMTHQNPLSIDVLIGFMLAKEVEIRNLKVLIKAKQAGLGEDFIEKELVIAY